MAAGVYVRRNSCDHRVHVGSSQDVNKRWCKHKKDLRTGLRHSRTLQAAWNRFGETEFPFEIVLTVINVDDLLFYEQCTMDRLNAESAEGGFNVRSKARAARGYKHSRKRGVTTDSSSIQADIGILASRVPLQAVGVYVLDRNGNLLGTCCDADTVGHDG